MELITVRFDAQEWPDEQLEELFSDGFPEFISADRLAKQYIGRIREWFAELNLMLVDEHGVPAATGWGIPIRWDGRAETLPSGYTDATIRAVENREQGVEPDTLVICGAVVTPALKGRGLAGEMLTALRQLAVERGWPRVIAPVRPTLKSRYPLAPIESFIGWTRPDGTALDPWIRTHQRLGARVIAAAPASQTMTGTVAEWEQWTGMAFPEPGDYVIPQGLSLLHVDQDTDQGTYVEPNVWMQHM
jgi:GNAT superfamily N-acetyltransferase